LTESKETTVRNNNSKEPGTSTRPASQPVASTSTPAPSQTSQAKQITTQQLSKDIASCLESN